MNATYFRAPTLYGDHLVQAPGWNYWVVHPEGRCDHHHAERREEFLMFSKGADDGTPPTDEGGR